MAGQIFLPGVWLQLLLCNKFEIFMVMEIHIIMKLPQATSCPGF